MRRIILFVASFGILLVQMVATMKGDDCVPAHGPTSYSTDMNKKFAAPDMDIEEFIKRFENQDRDVYVKRQDITRALGLRPGMPWRTSAPAPVSSLCCLPRKLGRRVLYMPWTLDRCS